MIGNTIFGYSRKSLSENFSGGGPSTNSTSNNNNSSSQLSATTSQNCNNTQNKSACQEQHQLLLKQQQEQPKPDNSCLFHPEQMKCKPDPITGKCPKGFSMNVYEHCFPNVRCPKGFENRNEDETGTCYPILGLNSTHIPVSK
jgi:hypothetical protein